MQKAALSIGLGALLGVVVIGLNTMGLLAPLRARSSEVFKL